MLPAAEPAIQGKGCARGGLDRSRGIGLKRRGNRDFRRKIDETGPQRRVPRSGQGGLE